MEFAQSEAEVQGPAHWELFKCIQDVILAAEEKLQDLVVKAREMQRLHEEK